MEIEGIDRVVIGVKDLDRGMEFFSRLLEVDFVEITGPAPAAGGVRFAVNLDKHIELISPVYPLKDANPPNPKSWQDFLMSRVMVRYSQSLSRSRVQSKLLLTWKEKELVY